MEKISVSDLNIGDWVIVEWPDGERWRGKLTQLSVTGAVEVCCADDKHVRCSDGFISAIPITAEILERNGFVKNGEYNEWNIGTWRTPYLLGVSLERPAITIKWNGSSVFIDQAKYIHDLQHALRLAKVGKEIVL